VTDPNPYQPPGSRVADGEGKRGSTWAAVLAGLAADVGGTFAGGIVVSFVLGVVLAIGGMPPEEMDGYMSGSAGYQVFSLLFGLAFTVLGGYVAARVANYRELWHGMLLGIASLAFGEIFIAMFDPGVQVWQRIAGFLLAVPAGIYGASLRRRVRRRSA
jgi:predicted cobalt transporter CbtA